MNGSKLSPKSQPEEYEYCITRTGLSASQTEVPRNASVLPLVDN